jgi:hypothetical protein
MLPRAAAERVRPWSLEITENEIDRIDQDGAADSAIIIDRTRETAGRNGAKRSQLAILKVS